MNRGEIWTVSGAAGYASKPRPAVILQANVFSDLDSVTICLLTSSTLRSPIFRLNIKPNQRNGLRSPSQIMVDKIVTIPKTRMGERIGALAKKDITRLDRAIFVFLGLAGA